MAKATFKGRPAVPGSVEGSAEVSHIGFNTCATYVDVLIAGSDSGVCQDHDNKDLFGHDLAGKIVCIPQTIGSSSAATLFMIILEKNIAPKAMLFANHIDSLRRLRHPHGRQLARQAYRHGRLARRRFPRCRQDWRSG